MSSILFVRTQAEAEAESTREVGRIRTDNAADSKCHLNFPRDCRQIYRECDWWGAWSPFSCESRCAIRGPSTTDMGRGLTKELVGLFKQGQASFGSDRSNQYNNPLDFHNPMGIIVGIRQAVLPSRSRCHQKLCPIGQAWTAEFVLICGPVLA